MTTRNTEDTKSRTPREETQRSLVYEEPDWLSIPEKTKQRFANDGMALRWIRVTLKGADDYQNIGKRVADGWEFVEPNEVPELMHSSFVREEGRAAGTVCRGDLALAKMPTELAESRQRFYEQKSRDMVKAVNAQLMRDSDSRMPIYNNSTTQVSRGQRPKFQED